jgi:ABC-type transport system involved in cytochrome c biogenesis permease subunit
MNLNVLYPSLLYIAFGCYFFSLAAFAIRREKIVFFPLMTGFSFHTLFLVNRASFTGMWIWFAFFESLFFLTWCMALIALTAKRFAGSNSSADSFIVPICALSLCTLLLPMGIMTPSPLSDTAFSAIFFSTESIAHAFFIAAGWSAFLHIACTGKPKWFHSFIVWGFVAYSIAQVSGAAWSYLGWSSPFHWNNRHLQSACIWCFYAALLHIRFVKGWTMKSEAWLSILGVATLVLFTVGGMSGEARMPRIGG